MLIKSCTSTKKINAKQRRCYFLAKLLSKAIELASVNIMQLFSLVYFKEINYFLNGTLLKKWNKRICSWNIDMNLEII